MVVRVVGAVTDVAFGDGGRLRGGGGRFGVWVRGDG